MNKVRKAVFPVAGLGTRFLPATKAMPKELLPVIDKPLIQYAAEEAIRADIDTLIFVTGKHKRAIEDHFDANYELEEALKQKGKFDEAAMVHNILPSGVECIFVRQAQQLGLGHAILCAKKAIGEEPFAVLLADDFLISQDNGVTSDLVKAYEKSGYSQLSIMEVDKADVSKYGIISLDSDNLQVTNLVEKPKVEEAPSNLASIGRYVLSPDIFSVLASNRNVTTGEIELSDALGALANAQKVEAVPLRGLRFDCGSVTGYLQAIKYVSDNLSL